MHLHLEYTDLVGRIFLSCADELDLVARLDASVHHLEVGDDTAERVEHRVEDEGLERSVRISLRSRNPLHDSVENLLYALAGLSRSKEHLLRLAAQKVYYLVSHDIDHSRVNVDLVEHRNDLEVVLDSEIKVGYCLCLDTLGSVHYQQRTLA